jgi:hypothetical protein
MSKLKEAAQALLRAMVNTDFTCRLGEETDALEAALAEPEPTGERAELIRQLRDVLGKSVHVDIANEAADMLEADAKPEYVPLTDDEIIKVAEQHLVLIDNGEFAFARAIERAVRGGK